MANDTAGATADGPSIDDLCPLLAAASFTHKAFPLMELPPELRLRIYKFAIHDTIDGILARPRGSKPVRSSSNWQEEWDGCPRFLGSLALLHSSREVRSEVKRDFEKIIDSQYSDMMAESCSLLAIWTADTFGSSSYAANHQAYVEAARDVGVMRKARHLLYHANGYWPTVEHHRIHLKKAARSRELFRNIPSKQSFRASPSAHGLSVFGSSLEAASDNLNLSENAFRLSDYQDTHDEDNPGNIAGQVSSDRDQSSLKRASARLKSKIDTNIATMAMVKHSSIDKKSSNLSKSVEWKEKRYLWKLRQQLRPGREQKTSTLSELNPAWSSLEVYARRKTVKLNKSDDWKERRHLWKLRQQLRSGRAQLDQQAITSSPFTLQIDNEQRVAGKKRKADTGATPALKKTKTTPNDATSSNDQQAFRLMDLPSDLRIRIYQHAVQGLVDTVTSTTYSRAQLLPRLPPFCGPFAFLHANSVVRSETWKALPVLLQVHLDELTARCRTLSSAAMIADPDSEFPEWEDLEWRRIVDHKTVIRMLDDDLARGMKVWRS